MEKKIQNLIDHPETLRKELELDQLEKLVYEVIGFELPMKYTVSPGKYGDYYFHADSEKELVNQTGIFSLVLKSCRIRTFISSISEKEDGYHVWFDLSLDYKHFHGGTNDMKIAEFTFQNGKWFVSDQKEN